MKKVLGIFALLYFATLSSSFTLTPEERYNQIASQVVCQCGCNIILKDCPHPTCSSKDKLKPLIQQGISNGESDEQILAALVTSYGERILAAPKPEGFNRVGWILPFVALLIGIGFVLGIVRRWSKAKEKISISQQTKPVDPSYLKKIEEELKRLEE
jgi:cytochrome c-type biogenesis protein CcmH